MADQRGFGEPDSDVLCEGHYVPIHQLSQNKTKQTKHRSTSGNNTLKRACHVDLLLRLLRGKNESLAPQKSSKLQVYCLNIGGIVSKIMTVLANRCRTFGGRTLMVIKGIICQTKADEPITRTQHCGCLGSPSFVNYRQQERFCHGTLPPLSGDTLVSRLRGENGTAAEKNERWACWCGSLGFCCHNGGSYIQRRTSLLVRERPNLKIQKWSPRKIIRKENVETELSVVPCP